MHEPLMPTSALYYAFIIVLVGGSVCGFAYWVWWDWRQEEDCLTQEVCHLAMYAQSDALGPEKFRANEASWLVGHGRVRFVATQNWLVWYGWKTSEGRLLFLINYHYLEARPIGFPIVQNDHAERLAVMDCGKMTEEEWAAWKRNAKSSLDQMLVRLSTNYSPLEKWRVNYC